MSHDRDHDHDHDHHPEAPSPIEARALALESLLVEKGLLTTDVVDRVVSRCEQDIGPMNGARIELYIHRTAPSIAIRNWRPSLPAPPDGRFGLDSADNSGYLYKACRDSRR